MARPCEGAGLCGWAVRVVRDGRRSRLSLAACERAGICDSVTALTGAGQGIHVCLHALLVFVRPVSAGFEFAGVLGWEIGRRFAFSR